MANSTKPIDDSIPHGSSAPPSFAINTQYHIFNPNRDYSSKPETPGRISLACMTCRTRKVRCNGKLPCNSCVSSNRECVFDHAKVNRRRKANTIPHHPPNPSTSTNPPSKITSFGPHSISNNPHSRSVPRPAAPALECTAGCLNKQEPLQNNQQSSHPLVEASLDTHSALDPPQQNEQLPPQINARIPYFRFLGPTAIAPGAPFREISMNLIRHRASQKVSRLDQLDTSPVPSASNCYASPISVPDTEIDLPLSEIDFCRQVDIYYRHLGSFISSFTKEDFLLHLSEKKASEALKLAISALAECIEPSSTAIDYAEIRSERAKSLVIPHLALPSLDTTLTLLLIAYCEFARDRDSGLWMWSGLAFRMATDLGLYKSRGCGPLKGNTNWNESESGLRERIFWSCYHLDRLISSGTGRVTTFLDSEIEIELPPIATIPTPHSSLASVEALLTPFHFLTKILILLGKISDAFNRSKTRDCSSTVEQHAYILQAFRIELQEFYASLPPVLHFTVDNARRYIEVEHGQAFLLIHLWFHTLVIITHTGTVGPAWGSLDVGPADSLLMEWSRASVRTISDMLAFGNLFDPDIYLSVPFASQPIMIAACANIPDQASPYNLLTSPADDSAQNQKTSTVQCDARDFNICSAALKNMHPRWRGVSWLLSTLNSRASYETDVDLSKSCDAQVNTCDGSLMNKLMIETNDEVLCFDTSVAAGPVFGLTASGTFHEPASGRLSLLHQPKALEPTSNQDPPSFERGYLPAPTRALFNPPISRPIPSGEGRDLVLSASANDYDRVGSSSGLEVPNALSRNLHGSTSWMTNSVPQIVWPGSIPVQSSELPLLSSKNSTHPGRINGNRITGDASPQSPFSANENLNQGSLSGNDQPLLPHEFLEKLFRGEVGVWQSFRYS